MKKRYVISAGLLLLQAAKVYGQTTYFDQNFAAGGTTASYVSATPGVNQVDGLSGLSATITNNAVQFTRSTNSGTGYISRSSNFAGTPTSLHVQFSFEVISHDPSVTGTTAVYFYVGSGFSSGPTNPNNGDTYARLCIALAPPPATSGQFQVRTVPAGGGGTTSATFSGRQTITFAMNNSGATLHYVSPTGAMENLPNDTYDIWVGSTKFANDQTVLSPGQSINNFKFRVNDGVGVMQIGNILMRDISGVLPVTLVSFTAKPEGNQVKLNWETTSERDADRFVVERSRDLGEYVAIGDVPARGTTDQRQYYTFVDPYPLDSISYYRLKQIDVDGQVTYVKPVSVSMDDVTPSLALIGNPTDGQAIHVAIRNMPNATYRLTTLSGREIMLKADVQANGSQILIPTQPLSTGIYLLRVYSGAKSVVQKVVVR
jgi:hypothetical protein